MSNKGLAASPKIQSQLRVVTPRQTVTQQIRDMWSYRELLGGLIRKELKVKYKNSVLGFLWSLLNPALYLAVFYFVFQFVMGNRIPRFAIFLLCGLLVWNFFSTALSGSCGAIVANASIVKKVAFPREILALANTGASLVHFFLQSIVLIAGLLITQHPPAWSYVPLIPLALLAVVILAGGLGIWLSAINVKMRDTQHLLELVILVWFWSTPIVYQYQLVAFKLWNNDIPTWIYQLNPITPIVLTFQRALYNDGMTDVSHVADNTHIIPNGSVLDYTWPLLICIGAGVVIFTLALRQFGKMQADFAEEL